MDSGIGNPMASSLGRCWDPDYSELERERGTLKHDQKAGSSVGNSLKNPVGKPFEKLQVRDPIRNPIDLIRKPICLEL